MCGGGMCLYIEGKTSSLKHNSGRKRKLSHKVRRILTRIVRKDHKNTASKIKAVINDHLEDTISSKTVRRELQKPDFTGGL